MQPELLVAHTPCAKVFPRRITVDVAIWIHKVHVIGCVVILPHEFQGLGFGELEYLGERKIELIEARAAKRIVMNQALPSDRLGINKRSRIEPMKSVLIRKV